MSDKKSLCDLVHDYLTESKESKSFNEIWEYISSELSEEEKVNPELMSKFYTNLILDGRFVTLGENIWDLRIRQPIEKVHIDMNAAYEDDEISEEDDDEDESLLTDENIDSDEL